MMSSRRTNDIEVLSEQLGSLQIMEETSTSDEQTDTEMSVAPEPMAVTSQENVQAVMGRLGHKQFLFSFSFIF